MAENNLKQQTKRGLYWKLAEQFSNYGLSFIIGIVMARLLSPEDYGITALPAVFMSIAGIFASGSFGAALIRKENIEEKDLSTAFYYSVGVGLFCYAILFCASPWIADFYSAPVLRPLIRVTALGFIYGPLGSIQSVLLQRRLDFETPAKISVATRLIGGVVGIVLAYVGYGVWALVISGMVGGIVNLIIVVSIVRWFPKTGWSMESFRYLWDFGNKMMGSYLIGTIYENIAPVIIGKYFSPADLGVYNRAEGYANMPSKNATGTLQSVTFPVLSKIQNDDERLARSYRQMLKLSAFVVFPLSMILAGIAHPLIVVMITDKWESCVILLQILCFGKMWYPIHAINLNLLEVKGRSDLFFRLEIIKRILGLLILVCSLPYGLVAFCYGSVCSSLLCLFVNTYYTGKLINVGYLKQMGDLLPSLMMSFFSFGVIMCINTFVANLVVQIVLGITFGGIAYICFAYLLKLDELNQLKFMLNFRH